MRSVAAVCHYSRSVQPGYQQAGFRRSVANCSKHLWVLQRGPSAVLSSLPHGALCPACFQPCHQICRQPSASHSPAGHWTGHTSMASPKKVACNKLGQHGDPSQPANCPAEARSVPCWPCTWLGQPQPRHCRVTDAAPAAELPRRLSVNYQMHADKDNFVNFTVRDQAYDALASEQAGRLPGLGPWRPPTALGHTGRRPALPRRSCGHSAPATRALGPPGRLPIWPPGAAAAALSSDLGII